MTKLAACWLPALALSLATLGGGGPGCAEGDTCFGRNGYVEFGAGSLPIILSAPHGGSLAPAEIQDRSSGTTASDLFTQELARVLAAALRARAGAAPSLILCHLKRSKLDVNRDVGEGALGNPRAEQAWNEFHGFMEAARAMAVARHGRALVIDVHGHDHPKPRLELGYLLAAEDLARPDQDLDSGRWAQRSSIRSIAGGSGERFSVLLRGSSSVGGLLERRGFASVPGPLTPGPGGDPYYGGGYITRRHGSADGGPTSAIQIEIPYAGFRDTSAARARLADALADALMRFVGTHMRIEF